MLRGLNASIFYDDSPTNIRHVIESWESNMISQDLQLNIVNVDYEQMKFEPVRVDHCGCR
eukprot:Pgem_evm1s16608